MKRPAFVVILIVLLSLTGITSAYAYSTMVSVTSHLPAEGYPIEIIDSQSNVVNELVIPSPNYDQYGNLTSAKIVNVTEYSLAIPWESSAYLRAWLFAEAAAVVYLENYYLMFGETRVDFDDSNSGQSNRVSELFQLVSGTHDFTLVLEYADTVPPGLPSGNIQLSFAAHHEHDPLSSF